MLRGRQPCSAVYRARNDSNRRAAPRASGQQAAAGGKQAGGHVPVLNVLACRASQGLCAAPLPLLTSALCRCPNADPGVRDMDTQLTTRHRRWVGDAMHIVQHTHAVPCISRSHCMLVTPPQGSPPPTWVPSTCLAPLLLALLSHLCAVRFRGEGATDPDAPADTFNVWLFNITNVDEVRAGGLPRLVRCFGVCVGGRWGGGRQCARPAAAAGGGRGGWDILTPLEV